MAGERVAVGITRFVDAVEAPAREALDLCERENGGGDYAVLALDHAEPFAEFLARWVAARLALQTLPRIVVVQRLLALGIIVRFTRTTSGASAALLAPCADGAFYLIAVSQGQMTALVLPRSRGAGTPRGHA